MYELFQNEQPGTEHSHTDVARRMLRAVGLEVVETAGGVTVQKGMKKSRKSGNSKNEEKKKKRKKRAAERKMNKRRLRERQVKKYI